MASFRVQKDRTYRAEIRLGSDQARLANEVIANKIRGFGFAGVSVSGSGRNRVVEASWLQDEATITVRRMGKVDMGESQFPLAELLLAIGEAEELRPAKENP